MKVFMVTCSKSEFIVPVSLALWDKHVDFDVEVINLGLEPVENWTSNVLRRLGKIKDEHIIFTLDDFLINSQFNYEVFDTAMSFMRAENVRYELGAAFQKKKIYKTIDSFFGFSVIQIDNSPYRLSCQPSVWNLQYLKKQLSVNGSPWQFETVISDATKNDGCKMIGTTGIYALDYPDHSALSKRWRGINYNQLSETTAKFVRENVRIP